MPEVMEKNTEHAGLTSRSSSADILKDAPVIGGREYQPEQPEKSAISEEEDKRKASAAPPSAEEEQPSEKTVSEEAEETASQPPEVIDFDETSEPVRIKVQGREWDRDDLLQAVKDHQDKENWQKTLSQKSQSAKWLDNLQPEQRDRIISRVIADAYGKEKIDMEVKPVTIKTTDEDDYEVEVEVKPGTPEFEALSSEFEKYFLEKYSDAFSELQQLQEEKEGIIKAREQLEAEEGQRHVVDFIKAKNIDLPRENLEENFATILKNGESDPRYVELQRLLRVATIAAQEKLPMTKVWDELFGSLEENSAKAQQIQEKDRQKQQGIRREGPGKSAPVITDDDKMRNALAKTQSAKFNKLFSKFGQKE